MYYKAKVKIKVENDNGKVKKVSEEYIVDAVCVTDVEAIITTEMTGMVSDWELVSVSETKIVKILDSVNE